MSFSDLPPELTFRIMEMTVEGLPASLRTRSDTLSKLSLVQQSWREPAQVLLESKVQLSSYAIAKMYMERPRRLDRRVILDELEVLFDFVSPEDDEFYPLTEWILRSFLMRDIVVRSLHLRSSLFVNAFDTSLLVLPAFKDLRHLRLEMPIEPPAQFLNAPISLARLSLSEMMDQPPDLFRFLLSNSRHSLVSLNVFVIKGGSPLHLRVLEILPDLYLSLRHLSVSSHWITLPESLLRFAISCRKLSTLSLTGIDYAQVLYLASTISSQLSAFDFTISSKSSWRNQEAQAAFEFLLAQPGFRNIREISITCRLESKGGETPSRLEEFRGRQMCKCTFERTLRRALP